MLQLFNSSKKILDNELLEQIEENLIISDIGVEITQTIIASLKKSKFNKEVSLDEIKEEVVNILYNSVKPSYKNDHIFVNEIPYVILVSGTNGSGKTTSIAKLAKYFKELGFSVLLSPCDTFRAGASIQLKKWAEKLNVSIFWDEKTKDPSAVAYKSIQLALEKKYDVLIIDTAGRLDNNSDLMNELKKIENTIKNLLPNAPQQSLLVLDGTIGQTALSQAKNFSLAIEITGLIMTKMDSQAKGGILLNITKTLKAPVYFLGIGEQEDKLVEFSLKDYIKNLLQ